MTKFMQILTGAGALAAGIAIVIVADRSGWLDRTQPSDVSDTPSHERSHDEGHDFEGHAHDGSQTADVSTGVSVVPAANTLPRARRTPSVECATAQSVVQFADAEIARQAGLVLETSRRQPMTHVLSCNAELAFDGNRVAHLAPRASGSVQKVLAQVGDSVREGDVLALVDSAELANSRATLLQAVAVEKLRHASYDRQVALSESGVTPRRELQDAQTALAEAQIATTAARQRLRNLGLNADAIDRIVSGNNPDELLPMIAPFSGVVVERHAVLGEVVDPSQVLFTIADTSRMWAMLDVYEADARHVKVGQPVVVSVQALPGETFAGTVTWVAPSLDSKTRTIKARAEIDNVEGLLKANMFGLARITVRDRTEALVVPKSAVQWEGCCNVVFVKHTDTIFQPYKVKLGQETDQFYVVEEGLPEGEQIVTQGSYLLKTEILKGSIGAGCCEVHGVTDSSGGEH